MVPVFHLSFAAPTVHRHARQRVKKSVSHDGLNIASRLTDCGRACIDYVYRDPATDKVTWRSEIADWMQHRHADAMRAHHCRVCFPGEVCQCDRCTNVRRLNGGIS